MALGKIKADTLEHSTAGSLDTQFVVNGSAKVWQNTNVTTLNDSNNVSSITDTATGKLTVNYTTNMGNANYAVTMNCAIQSQVPICYCQDSSFNTTSTHRVNTEIEGGALSDAEYIGSTVQGDLA